MLKWLTATRIYEKFTFKISRYFFFTCVIAGKFLSKVRIWPLGMKNKRKLYIPWAMKRLKRDCISLQKFHFRVTFSFFIHKVSMFITSLRIHIKFHSSFTQFSGIDKHRSFFLQGADTFCSNFGHGCIRGITV